MLRDSIHRHLGFDKSGKARFLGLLELVGFAGGLTLFLFTHFIKNIKENHDDLKEQDQKNGPAYIVEGIRKIKSRAGAFKIHLGAQMFPCKLFYAGQVVVGGYAIDGGNFGGGLVFRNRRSRQQRIYRSLPKGFERRLLRGSAGQHQHRHANDKWTRFNSLHPNKHVVSPIIQACFFLSSAQNSKLAEI